MHITFVDNQDFERLLLKIVINRLSAQVQFSEVASAKALLEFLNSGTGLPDIIFLDYDMPEQDGVDCLRELRDNSRFRNIPVIMYANLALPQQLLAAWQNGADYYLVKPFDLREISSIFEWCIANKPQRNPYRDRTEFLISPQHLPAA
jgi:CheY-like chemotaxis protein